jgi:hypothetical protein
MNIGGYLDCMISIWQLLSVAKDLLLLRRLVGAKVLFRYYYYMEFACLEEDAYSKTMYSSFLVRAIRTMKRLLLVDS